MITKLTKRVRTSYRGNKYSSYHQDRCVLICKSYDMNGVTEYRVMRNAKSGVILKLLSNKAHRFFRGVTVFVCVVLCVHAPT
jgi:hypothetical protein